MSTLSPGAFCWVDLFTHDTAAAENFYGTLFGWQARPAHQDEDGVYRIFSLREQPAAGLMAMTAEMKTMGVPPHWTSHVLVHNVDETAKNAQRLGGTVLKGPCVAVDHGVLGVLEDPTGAVFCIWESKRPQGGDVAGACIWNELWTRDVERACRFYSGLFGWDIQPQEPCSRIVNRGRKNGGIMALPQHAAERGARSAWVVYFAVADCEMTVAAAQAAGGRVFTPPLQLEGLGRVANLADPQGAFFALLQPDRAKI